MATGEFTGIPTEGYDVLAERLLEGSDVRLRTDYFEFIKEHLILKGRL